MTCTTCGSNRRCYDKKTGLVVCFGCYGTGRKIRRGLTSYEALKLKWYRSEKSWHDHIKSRQIVTDRKGNKHVIVPGQGEVPQQPRQYWAPPKVKQ